MLGGSTNGERTGSPAVGPPAAGAAVPGRARTAGRLLVGGGVGLALSACLPWFTVLGVGSGQLPAGSFVVFGAAGALLAYLGVRALRGRATRRVMAGLWVLAGLAALVAVSLFVGANDLQQSSGGTASPAFGFDLAIVALLCTVAGTVLLQASRRRRPPA